MSNVTIKNRCLLNSLSTKSGEPGNMIINMNTYQTSLAEFINERKQAMAKIAAGQPWLLLIATPIYVNTEKIDPLEDNFRKILTDPPAPVDKWSDGIHSGRPEPRLFGIEATFPRAHPDYEKALRLFRNGHLEYCQRIWGNHEESTLPISARKNAIYLIQFLKVANKIQKLAEISEPITVILHFQNIKRSFLLRPETPYPFMAKDSYVWQKENLSIEITVSELSEYSKIAHTIINRLFNAFGYEDNPLFDSDGKFFKK